MNQTEKYLNGILSKRLGSVVNQAAFSKDAHTVARLPLQEEPMDKMPTVFRKKYETVLIQRQSVARESKFNQIVESHTTSTEREPVENHRVEYMAISKRISMKKTEDYVSPTIDVNKYESKYGKRPSSISPSKAQEQHIQMREATKIRISEDVNDNSKARTRRRKIFS